MAWWRKWARTGKGDARKRVDEEYAFADTLAKEIQEAHRDWVNAHRNFEYAQGKDQVDYAIFAIEAAEKRYEMLLRHAKSLSVAWTMERGVDVG